MKRKNDNNPKQYDEEDLDFLDDRMQLLDTIHDMIDIEFERRGLKPEEHPYPGNSPPDGRGREPPRRTLWQRIVNLFTGCL